MNLEKEKVLKLVIVVLATLAAGWAVMSTLVQLIQTISAISHRRRGDIYRLSLGAWRCAGADRG